MNSTENNIQHTALLVKDLAQLHEKNDLADVTFIVESKRIPAHRVILAARSEYFQSLLYGALMESKQDEIVLSVQLKPFQCLLQYIYSGSLSLDKMDQEELIDLVMLADQYGFGELKSAIGCWLCKKIRLTNVCILLRCSSLFQLGTLYDACLQYMDRHAAHVILHKSFLTLTFNLLNVLLDRKSFLISEVEKFHAIHKWCQQQKDSAQSFAKLYRKVSYTSMTYNQLFHIVRPSRVLLPDELLDVIAVKEDTEVVHTRPIRSSIYKREMLIQRNNGLKIVKLEYGKKHKLKHRSLIAVGIRYKY